MSLGSFNKELLNDRLSDYRQKLARTVEQHRLLVDRLHSAKVRFNRATEQGKFR